MVCEPYNRMFCANLIMPNGYRNSYSVSARNKTEARKRGSAEAHCRIIPRR